MKRWSSWRFTYWYIESMEGVEERLMRIILYIQELKWAKEEGVSIFSYGWNFVRNRDKGVFEVLMRVSDLRYKNIWWYFHSNKDESRLLERSVEEKIMWSIIFSVIG